MVRHQLFQSEYSISRHFLDPLFATSAGETMLTIGTRYTPAMTEELVTGEMTRREIRER